MYGQVVSRCFLGANRYLLQTNSTTSSPVVSTSCPCSTEPSLKWKGSFIEPKLALLTDLALLHFWKRWPVNWKLRWLLLTGGGRCLTIAAWYCSVALTRSRWKRGFPSPCLSGDFTCSIRDFWVKTYRLLPKYRVSIPGSWLVCDLR